MMDIEFEVGDLVTFSPYGKGMELYVQDISIGNPWLENDDRIFYHLAVPSTGAVTNITTGMWIKESKLFNPEVENV